jgi:hypothetical protein
MAPTYFREVRCSGCRRRIGLSKTDAAIYCDRACVEDYSAASTEARDALLEAVYLTKKPSLRELGAMFGFTLQNAHQILKKRDVKKQVVTNR